MKKIILLSLLVLFASGVSALGTTPKGNGVVIITLDPVNTTNNGGILPLAESYVWWNWSGSLSIPDGSSGSGTWVGINCNTPSGIPSGAVVTKVKVHHEITHTFIGDLEVKIYNEQTSHVWMVRNREGGSADNINETKTEYSIFDGDNPTQKWYYRVRDVWGGDTGTLDVMQLYVYYETAAESGYIVSASPSSFTGGVATTVTVRVRNTGDSDDMIIEWDSKPSGWSINPGYRNPYMTSGSYYNAIFTVTPPVSGGSGTIVWKFYDDDILSNDLLDTYYQSVSATAQKPDFIITDLDTDPISPVCGEPFTVSVTVTNQGPVAGNAGYLDMWINKSSTASCGEQGDDRFYVGTLNAGQSYFITFFGGALSAAPSPGGKTLRAFIDSGCITSEEIESNNQSTHSYTVIETISPPTSISGVSSTYVDKNESYTASGATSSGGHSLQYQFDWGDGNFSGWGSATQSHSYGNSSTYNVKARARCATHPTYVSSWSETLKSVSVSWVQLNTNVNPIGAGSVTKSPDRPVGYSYGEIVQLTANANSGYIFDYWSGDASRSSNPISITMNSNKTITANFRSTPVIRIEPNLLEFEYSPSIGSSAASYDREPLQVERFMESSVNEQVQLPAYDGPQQSKTGPTPPPGVPEKIREIGILAEVTLPSVPPYSWRHGCGPTAVGMVVGYHDSQSYNDLITGDASTQTDEVNQAIASGGTSGSPYPSGSEQHYEDYSRPEDPPPGVMQTDDYITQARIPHSDNCIGDYMDTSKSTRDNRYGWSWSSDVGPSFVSYVDQQNLSYNPSYQQYQMGSTLTWNILTTEIDNGRPMVFLVDTDADGGTDHFVTVVGYRDTPSQQYGCLDTWAPADIVRWCDFAQMSGGQPWGIWGGWSFSLAPLSEDSFTIYNDGTADLEVNSISKRDGDAWLASWAPDAPFTIVPGGSQTVVVNIDGALGAPGLNEEQLIVLSNDDDKSPYPGGVYVNLTVTCVSTTIEQPPQDITICEGQDAVFDIVATGSGPLHYQWKKDSVDVGSDSSMLTLSNMQLADDGSEVWCEVTNACDSIVASTSAFLTVYPWPTVTINPNPDQLNAGWILDGPNGYTYSNNGDETIADLEFGSYTITWSSIPRWNTPLLNPDTKNLSVGNSINFIGNYQLIADLNNDYSVDYEDLARLANEWLWTGQSGGIPEDIMQDGIVNFADFALLAQNWLAGVTP